MILRSILVLSAFLCLGTVAEAQSSSQSCSRPAALQEDAFDKPMSFSWATTKGNMTTSAWIAAVGVITEETPQEFREFLDREGADGAQVVLHSPGGNLAAGLELGRIFRAREMTTHIGRSQRQIETHDSACDTWFDDVEAGVCASSCAYAFLGGRERFVSSPYYPTTGNLLGFHQFYGNPSRGSAMMSADEVEEIEATTLSVAQALTGQIVLYAIEMGVDPSIVAFASATASDDLYYPSEQEIEELSIASGSGLSDWFMEPYGTGLVVAARPQRSDSMLEQVTAFCSVSDGRARLLFTMDLVTPSYPDPEDLPLKGIGIMLDDKRYLVGRDDLKLRYGDGKIFMTALVDGLKTMISDVEEVSFSLEAARVMGGFREGNSLDETARKSLKLAWRNCI